MFWILCCMNMQTWWSKKGWFVLYIKWKQTLLSVLWLGGVSRAGRGGPWGKAWRCLASRHTVSSYLPFFGMCQASILSQEEELLGDLEIETNPIRVCFVGKLRHFFRETPKSKSKLMKLLRLLIIQRLHGVSQSSGGSVLPTALVEIIYRGYDHSYCAEPRSISETLWCIYNCYFCIDDTSD